MISIFPAMTQPKNSKNTCAFRTKEQAINSGALAKREASAKL